MNINWKTQCKRFAYLETESGLQELAQLANEEVYVMEDRFAFESQIITCGESIC